jgi:ribosome biogenesis GTPase
MPRKRSGQKKRVEFRKNRQPTRRRGDWTARYQRDEVGTEDTHASESLRGKGDVSRKRTILVDDTDAPRVDEERWMPGTITAIHGLICRVDDPAGQNWDCTVRRVLRTLLIEQRAPVVAGDRVWFSDQSAAHDGQPVGVIERVAPRTSMLSRRDARGREHGIVANADQILIVASVAQPRLKPHLIDRYLIAAGKGGLRPIICLNKMDLLEGDDEPPGELRASAHAEPQPDGESEPDDETVGADPVEAATREFASLGYRVLRTSAVSGLGVEELRAELLGHTTVLSGQSGVGKSSLLNAVEPGLGLVVGEVSDENEKGRHTTTVARLLRLRSGGAVVDTPGIRQFDLWSVEPGELEAYFTEFQPYISQCRFRDCHHRNEEGCAVAAAAESGEISRRRYRSYVKALEEMARK